MLNEIGYAFPAGDESDGSNDEWDIGYSDNNKKPCAEVKEKVLSHVQQHSSRHMCYILASIRLFSLR